MIKEVIHIHRKKYNQRPRDAGSRAKNKAGLLTNHVSRNQAHNQSLKINVPQPALTYSVFSDVPIKRQLVRMAVARKVPFWATAYFIEMHQTKVDMNLVAIRWWRPNSGLSGLRLSC